MSFSVRYVNVVMLVTIIIHLSSSNITVSSSPLLFRVTHLPFLSFLPSGSSPLGSSYLFLESFQHGFTVLFSLRVFHLSLEFFDISFIWEFTVFCTRLLSLFLESFDIFFTFVFHSSFLKCL